MPNEVSELTSGRYSTIIRCRYLCSRDSPRSLGRIEIELKTNKRLDLGNSLQTATGDRLGICQGNLRLMWRGKPCSEALGGQWYGGSTQFCDCTFRVLGPLLFEARGCFVHITIRILATFAYPCGDHIHSLLRGMLLHTSVQGKL
jgi:hypothetical protein